jgi:hypothetical protein
MVGTPLQHLRIGPWASVGVRRQQQLRQWVGYCRKANFPANLMLPDFSLPRPCPPKGHTYLGTAKLPSRRAGFSCSKAFRARNSVFRSLHEFCLPGVQALPRQWLPQLARRPRLCTTTHPRCHLARERASPSGELNVKRGWQDGELCLLRGHSMEVARGCTSVQ